MISLLVAFSLVALVAAGTMLAAGAHAEVQRRLSGFGVQRALGFTPGPDRRAAGGRGGARRGAGRAARARARRARRRRAVGRAARRAQRAAARARAARAARARAARASWRSSSAAATWPAWRAARRPPAEILRGGDLAARRAGERPRGGLLALGARFATAARGRWLAAVATIAVCAGVVTLMLALASLLERLRDDPGTVGKRYQLTVALATVHGAVDARDVPGVDAVGARYASTRPTRSGSASRCGSSPTPATTRSSRRRRWPRAGASAGRARSRSGSGWPTRSGCAPARRSPRSSRRRRGALPRRGRRARARERRPDRAGCSPTGCSRAPDLDPQLVVRLEPGRRPRRGDARADRARRRAAAASAPPRPQRAFLAVLAAVLRGVGLAVGLVCLYALVQALTMTARERRGAVALLRACGGDAPDGRARAGGRGRRGRGPGGDRRGPARAGRVRAARRAARGRLRRRSRSRRRPGQVALVAVGLLALAAAATALVARRVLREPVVAGLREE